MLYYFSLSVCSLYDFCRIGHEERRPYMCNNDSEFNTILQHLHNNQNPTAQNNNTFTSDYLQQRTASEKKQSLFGLKTVTEGTEFDN